MKNKLITVLLLFLAMGARSRVSQSWEEIVPRERVYYRIDEVTSWYHRWFSYPDTVVVTLKDIVDRYIVTFGEGYQNHVKRVYIMGHRHTSQFWQSPVPYVEFNKHYRE